MILSPTVEKMLVAMEIGEVGGRELSLGHTAMVPIPPQRLTVIRKIRSWKYYKVLLAYYKVINYQLSTFFIGPSCTHTQ